MTTKTTNYKYDPVARVLTVYDADKPRGFFKGDYAEQEFLRLMSKGVDITFTDMNSNYNVEHSQKVRKLRAIWIKLGIDQYREDILSENYGIKSTTQLSIPQLNELIAYYSGTTNSDDKRIRELRSQLLTLCNKLGIYVTNNDWSRVNAFFMDKRVAGKLLSKMTLEELQTLIPKVRSILSKHYRKQEDIKRQQLMN